MPLLLLFVKGTACRSRSGIFQQLISLLLFVYCFQLVLRLREGKPQRGGFTECLTGRAVSHPSVVRRGCQAQKWIFVL